MADSVGVKPISEALSLWKPSTQKGSIFSYRPNSGQKDRNFFSISTNLQIKQQSSLVISQVTQPIYTKGGALVSLVQIKKGLIVDLDV